MLVCLATIMGLDSSRAADTKLRMLQYVAYLVTGATLLNERVPRLGNEHHVLRPSTSQANVNNPDVI